MPYHTPPPSLRLRRFIHRLVDPLRSLHNHRETTTALHALGDGEYRHHANVPYIPQFATPSLINDYIYGNLHGRDDPNWRTFGAVNPETYHFWAHRVCAIACIKMAMEAFQSAPPVTLWEMVRAGMAQGGYRIHDEDGNPIDEGWFFEPLVRLGEQYGLEVAGLSYISELEVCRRICDGWLVAAAVTPEIGERGFPLRYDGHFVLVFGFTWKSGTPEYFILHNPSGRSADLQASAHIPASRFRQTFAHRCMMFRPLRS